MSTPILAEVNTGSFVFRAVANDESHAKTLLLQAYARHARATGADPVLMSELLADGEMEFHVLTPGVVTRDGAPILYRRPS